MGFPATKLSGHVENGGGLSLFSTQSPDHFGSKIPEIIGEVCSVEKFLRILIIFRSTPIPDMIEMHRKFRSIERSSLS
jgi:hypothetical protein